MRNIEKLVTDWNAEIIELDEINFVSVSELAQFIHYAFNSLDQSEFDFLMFHLIDLT